MLLLATLVVLFSFATHRLTVIRRTRTARIDPYQLESWPRIAWVLSLILMGLDLLALVVGVALTTRSGFPPPEWLQASVQLARIGSFVLVSLAMVIALWERTAAAALLALTAMASPLAMELDAILVRVPLSEGEQAAFTTAMAGWAVFFTLPTMIVALLLWTSVPGPGSTPDDPAPGGA